MRVAPPEAYRAAGVDYNAVLPGTQVSCCAAPDGRPYLRMTSDRAVQEPFVDVILEMNWSSGRLVREYTMLFDPPSHARAAAGARAAPPSRRRSRAAPAPRAGAAGAAPPQRRRRRPRRAPPRRPAAPAPRRGAAPRRAAAAGAAPAPAPRAAARRRADEYRVRPGDTLSRIADTTQRPGVSLDQMLVALYRGNPEPSSATT